MAIRSLSETIRELVREQKYVVGLHASERLEGRRIMKRQAVNRLLDGEWLREQLDARPNPAIEAPELLPTGAS